MELGISPIVTSGLIMQVSGLSEAAHMVYFSILTPSNRMLFGYHSSD